MPDDNDKTLNRLDSLEGGHSDLRARATETNGRLTILESSVTALSKSLDTFQNVTDRHLVQQDLTTATLKDLIQTLSANVQGLMKILTGDLVEGKSGLHQKVGEIKQSVDRLEEAAKERKKMTSDVKIGAILAVIGAVVAIGEGIALAMLHLAK